MILQLFNIRVVFKNLRKNHWFCRFVAIFIFVKHNWFDCQDLTTQYLNHSEANKHKRSKPHSKETSVLLASKYRSPLNDSQPSECDLWPLLPVRLMWFMNTPLVLIVILHTSKRHYCHNVCFNLKIFGFPIMLLFKHMFNTHTGGLRESYTFWSHHSSVIRYDRIIFSHWFD